MVSVIERFLGGVSDEFSVLDKFCCEPESQWYRSKIDAVVDKVQPSFLRRLFSSFKKAEGFRGYDRVRSTLFLFPSLLFSFIFSTIFFSVLYCAIVIVLLSWDFKYSLVFYSTYIYS